ncbi:MAG TPA: hypothetical protein EYP35_01550 [Desulfobacterales bacterium]|nr:hypothetical protein [Desulfobacterales bacterium]HIP40578.1 hypothetical protein [Desulfocapsa sulfexigens]
MLWQKVMIRLATSPGVKQWMQIIEKGGEVRLVKGAFTESESIAHTSRKEINISNFGTHDEQMIDKTIEYADGKGWKRDAYEFEFLLGVREALQDRLYVPFGTEWWAYSVRRVGENPRNGLFLLRSLCYR